MIWSFTLICGCSVLILYSALLYRPTLSLITFSHILSISLSPSLSPSLSRFLSILFPLWLSSFLILDLTCSLVHLSLSFVSFSVTFSTNTPTRQIHSVSSKSKKINNKKISPFLFLVIFAIAVTSSLTISYYARV